MEALIIKHNFTAGITLKEIMTTFFRENTPDSTRVLFWKFFQCWVTRDCNIKADLSDEEIALFFDQLIDLVAAAYKVHQANRVCNKNEEGDVHE
ncbi:hypothetical protein [Mucilaginibacter sp. UYCu711]|uniref:hypothetical protein n=1 Tax=Mucilaginibacter sp. UYCu711 TaxID=3156339 RepID=UPI003D24C4B7